MRFRILATVFLFVSFPLWAQVAHLEIGGRVPSSVELRVKESKKHPTVQSIPFDVLTNTQKTLRVERDVFTRPVVWETRSP